jgi:hypothetical protein
VLLLYGTVPAWRTLDQGVSGADVSQLNHDLAALGDAPAAQLSAAGWSVFSPATQAGVAKLRSALGVSGPSGSLNRGSFAFEPGALRIATVTGGLGGPASGPVLTATSTEHVVTIALDASQQGEVKAGDAVIITLPNGSAVEVAGQGGSRTLVPVTTGIFDDTDGLVQVTGALILGERVVVPSP